ncbi:MAG: 4Fe-4S dicluster domain-containing protein [Chloroflexi bacterium]|nr:4Fe-4S dicluster domain-containing protein [Chloroflexota bacterium]
MEQQVKPEIKEKARTEGAKKGEEKVTFYHQWCKKCGICAAICPRSSLSYDKEGCPYLSDPEGCESCGLCELLCPDFAISVPARHEERQ